MNTILDSINLWSTAQTLKTSNRGLSASNQSLLGIKKLRELILELAVRGKLVPQDPDDESASVLLRKIEKEKQKLIKKGEIRKPKVLPEITDDEIPFDLPQGWVYSKLNNLGDWGAGATPNRSKHEYYGGNIPWFKSGELNGDYISISEEFVTDLALKETSLRYDKVGDVLIAMYGATIGKTSILEIPATTNQAVCACTPFPGIFNVFLLTLLKAYKSRFIGMGAGGAQPNISREKLIATVIALPPLTEQHRIVAKVDELMTLCDQLELQQTNSNASHQTLVETLLGTLTTAENPAAFDEAWQRFATHLDTLLTTEHSIDQFKQTILQLAVMGKLTQQNPSDEPTSELLKKIAKEKAQLVKEGKIKKQAPLPKIPDDEKPFELPEGWEWISLGTYAIVFSGNSFKSEDFNEEGGTKVIKITNAGVCDFVETNDFLPASFLNEYEQYVVRENDLILALTRPYISTGLKISKCPRSYNNSLLNQRVAAIRVNTGLEYVFLFLQSSFVLNLYMERFGNSGLQPNLKVSDVTELILPIPPLSEQHLIVSIVDELFALCDELKDRLVEAQTLQNQMAVAVVEQALSNKPMEKATYSINEQISMAAEP